MAHEETHPLQTSPFRRGLLIALAIGAALGLWFVPWVATIHTGLVFMFPYHADGQSRFLRATGPVTSLWSDAWISWEEMPKACPAALVAAEDTRFYQHGGVDWEELEASRKANQRAKKVKRGGSTITQQLVKNLFLSRDRSYLRKARELSGALLLDLIASKETQLTWYLNAVEFGPDTYGLAAAAQRYFKKNARKLAPSECAALIAIVPSPNKWNKSLEKKALTGFLRRRIETIVRRMEILGQLPRREIQLAHADALFRSGGAPESGATLTQTLAKPAAQAPEASLPPLPAPLDAAEAPDVDEPDDPSASGDGAPEDTALPPTEPPPSDATSGENLPGESLAPSQAPSQGPPKSPAAGGDPVEDNPLL